MQNKILINKLKENAELAMASYGYFHLTDKTYKHSDKDEKRLKEFRELKAKALGKDIDESIYPTYADILNMEYKYFKDKKTGKLKDDLFDDDFLGGDMTPTQAKRFFSRYDLLIHQPNTESGFSATLFQNKESKEYTLAFRGTEPSNIGDIKTDMNLTFKNLPTKQYLDMLLFYNQCIGKIPFYVESDSIPNDKDSLE